MLNGRNNKKKERFLKNDMGTFKISVETLLEKWKRYFDDLFNCNEPEDTLNLNIINGNNKYPEPTLEEIEIQIKILKIINFQLKIEYKQNYKKKEDKSWLKGYEI